MNGKEIGSHTVLFHTGFTVIQFTDVLRHFGSGTNVKFDMTGSKFRGLVDSTSDLHSGTDFLALDIHSSRQSLQIKHEVILKLGYDASLQITFNHSSLR
jgi:hypothetical protein